MMVRMATNLSYLILARPGRAPRSPSYRLRDVLTASQLESRARARYTATYPCSYRHSLLSSPLLSHLLGASFHRLYEFFIIDWNVQLRNELEYFYCAHADKAVSSIPDQATRNPSAVPFSPSSHS
ncbi:hypothetical protein BGY98DRAFT_1161324 [Russula aff. rugulosa BPL654]|nr:hypothetical protein BGY98DRAFT_1161324 [Russula aff. rugulosa BPL654]